MNFTDEQILIWGPLVLFVWAFVPYTLFFLGVHSFAENMLAVRALLWAYWLSFGVSLYLLNLVIVAASSALTKITNAGTVLAVSFICTHWLIPHLLFIFFIKGAFPSAWDRVSGALRHAQKNTIGAMKE